MRIKRIKIGVKDWREGLRDLSSTVREAESGYRVEPRDPQLFFIDLEALRDVLTPRRIDLLKIVHREKPASVYRLAKLAGRALKNVQQDVELLARVGLLELTRSSSSRRRLIPRVDYDAMRLELSIR